MADNRDTIGSKKRETYPGFPFPPSQTSIFSWFLPLAEPIKSPKGKAAWVNESCNIQWKMRRAEDTSESKQEVHWHIHT